MHKGRRDEHKQTDHLNANVLEQDKQSSQKARSIKTPWSVFLSVHVPHCSLGIKLSKISAVQTHSNN